MGQTGVIKIANLVLLPPPPPPPPTHTHTHLMGQTGLIKQQIFLAVRVLFLPMVSGWAGGGKKFVRAVSQKLYGVGS